MSIYFDSKDLQCKNPFGAVLCGTEVSFSLLCSREEDICAGVLRLRAEFAGLDRTVPLAPSGGAWGCSVTAPEEPDLLWYDFTLTRGSGETVHLSRSGGPWQLTVYEDTGTPDWFGRGVSYQIFPDRFCRSRLPQPEGLVGERTVHESWEDTPDYLPDEKGEIRNCDFFGGDFRGITEKLDYLQSLSVTTLYLNPIFEAASNHRYNTADYRAVDPMLGTEEDFRELCRQAHKRGMRLLLDGVFNHTGSVSRYFNRDGFYPELGAAQSQASPYYNWYHFTRWPEEYDAWWGIKTLPAVDEGQDSYRAFIIRDRDSVVRRWLRAGADGWRLDVADELPDEALALIRTAAKEEKPDALILGEVWEDAVTKESYGKRRNYALGFSLDSVMNYPFRNAVLAFARGQSSAYELRDFLIGQQMNYPKPFYYSLMNLLGTHDVDRIRTALSVNFDIRALSREDQVKLNIPQEALDRAVETEKLCALIQFAIPGVPSIYYGDEQGMCGVCDPFNRQPFKEGVRTLHDCYARLAAKRRGMDAISTGEAEFMAESADILMVLRYINNGADALGRPAGNGACLAVINRGEHDADFAADCTKAGCGMYSGTIAARSGQIFTLRQAF